MGNAVDLIYDGKSELAEGPVWHQGKLWWVNITTGELNCLDVEQGTNVSRATGDYLGAAVPADDDRWLIAGRHDLGLLDWATGQIEPVACLKADPVGYRCNDGKCDPAGRFWIGTMRLEGQPGAGALYCLDHDLSLSQRLPDVTISNGLGWSPDETQFYYTDTTTQRVDLFDYDVATGDIANRRVLVEIPAEQGAPDGMAIDADGNVWVALWGGSAVQCYDGRSGEQLDRIELPVSQVSSCCFGGAKRDQLFITTARQGVFLAIVARDGATSGRHLLLPPRSDGPANDSVSQGGVVKRLSSEQPYERSRSFQTMKITEVKVWLVEGVKYNWTMMKVYTDAGLTGVGEATNWPGSPIIEAAARHVGDRVIGLDPLRTDFIWNKMYRDLNWIGPYGASMCAISGLDMALLDLKGKAFQVPCYQLLGGAFRTDLLLYANYWFTGGDHTPQDYARQAERVKQLGFTGLKFDPFAHTSYLYGDDLQTNLTLSPAQQELAFEVTSAVREAVGKDFEMMIETHAMLNFEVAVKMAERLAPLGVTWYEEPAGPENVNTLRAFRERLPSNVPICVGERHYTRHGFRPVLEQHICDVIMPDITRCGGPSEMKRIATMAEAYGVLLAPHNPNGPLSTLASAHVCASVPNFFRCEFMLNDVPWRDQVIDHPLDIDQGMLRLSDRPGLGVDLVEEELEKHPGIRELNARDNFYV